MLIWLGGKDARERAERGKRESFLGNSLSSRRAGGRRNDTDPSWKAAKLTEIKSRAWWTAEKTFISSLKLVRIRWKRFRKDSVRLYWCVATFSPWTSTKWKALCALEVSRRVLKAITTEQTAIKNRSVHRWIFERLVEFVAVEEGFLTKSKFIFAKQKSWKVPQSPHPNAALFTFRCQVCVCLPRASEWSWEESFLWFNGSIVKW